MRIRSLFLAGGLMASALAACSDDETNPTPSLAGNYVLLSWQQPPGPVLTPPAATGTITLTETTYTAAFNLAGNVVNDQGTYAVTSTGQWTQQSNTVGAAASGTYTISGTTLTVDVTITGAGIRQIYSLQKQ